MEDKALARMCQYLMSDTKVLPNLATLKLLFWRITREWPRVDLPACFDTLLEVAQWRAVNGLSDVTFILYQGEEVRWKVGEQEVIGSDDGVNYDGDEDSENKDRRCVG
jgi:hypothetical protein